MKITRSIIAMESYSIDIVRLSEELTEMVDLVKESEDAEYFAAKSQHLISDIYRCCSSLWDVMQGIVNDCKNQEAPADSTVYSELNTAKDNDLIAMRELNDRRFYSNNQELFLDLIKDIAEHYPGLRREMSEKISGEIEVRTTSIAAESEYYLNNKPVFENILTEMYKTHSLYIDHLFKSVLVGNS